MNEFSVQDEFDRISSFLRGFDSWEAQREYVLSGMRDFNSMFLVEV